MPELKGEEIDGLPLVGIQDEDDLDDEDEDEDEEVDDQ